MGTAVGRQGKAMGELKVLRHIEFQICFRYPNRDVEKEVNNVEKELESILLSSRDRFKLKFNGGNHNNIDAIYSHKFRCGHLWR